MLRLFFVLGLAMPAHAGEPANAAPTPAELSGLSDADAIRRLALERERQIREQMDRKQIGRWVKQANRETERAMRRLDANGDGRITEDELAEYTWRQNREREKERVRRLRAEGWRVHDLGEYEDCIDHNGDPLPGCKVSWP